MNRELCTYVLHELLILVHIDANATYKKAIDGLFT